MPLFTAASASKRRVAPYPLVLFLGSSLLMGAALSAEEVSRAAASSQTLPSDLLLRTLQPAALRELAQEVLELNPEVARARFAAAAAMARIPQARSWPEPMGGLTYFVLPPETRVGPQQIRAGLAQRFPWFGKLDLREEAATLAASSAEARVETARLDALTEARRLYFELSFLAQQEEILRSERSTLDRFEQAARARYSTGSGLQQGVIRVQAQITKVDHRLLSLQQRRASLIAMLAGLRNRPVTQSLEIQAPGVWSGEWISTGDLRSEALRFRPEVASLHADLARGDLLIELAMKQGRPDVTLGLSYTLVGQREDDLGMANPPQGNGDDILALSASMPLPLRRNKLDAELLEAQQNRLIADQKRAGLLASIEQDIGDLEARIPLLLQQLRLLETVLLIQAREGLQSAEIAYVTGKLDALDLLDAEVMLFEVRTSIARLRTDLHIAHADLERAVARPVSLPTGKATS